MRFLVALRSRLFGPADASPPPADESVAPPCTPAEPGAVDQQPPTQASLPRYASERESKGEVSPGAEVPDPAVPARQERAAGWLLDDERLRGDLTDDEYQPLLDWALAATDRLAEQTAGMSDDAADRALDDGLRAVKNVVTAAREAVAAHVEGDAERRTGRLQRLPNLAVPPAVVDGEAAAARLADLASDVGREPAVSGADLAARIADALGGPAGDGGQAGDTGAGA